MKKFSLNHHYYCHYHFFFSFFTFTIQGTQIFPRNNFRFRWRGKVLSGTICAKNVGLWIRVSTWSGSDLPGEKKPDPVTIIKPASAQTKNIFDLLQIIMTLVDEYWKKSKEGFSIWVFRINQIQIRPASANSGFDVSVSVTRQKSVCRVVFSREEYRKVYKSIFYFCFCFF